MSENDAQVNTADEQESTQETENNETGTEDRTFTQPEVNKIIAERVARAKERFSDYDDLKEQVQTLTEYKESEAARIEAAKAEAAEAAKNDLKSTFTNARVLDVIAYEAKGQFTDPSDALLHLKERSTEFINEAGEVDEQAVSAAVSELLEKKPHLAIKNSSSPADVGLGQTGVSKPPTSNAGMFAEFLNSQLGR